MRRKIVSYHVFPCHHVFHAIFISFSSSCIRWGNIRQRSRSGARHGGGSRGSRRRDGAIVARLAGASDCEHMSVPLFLRWTACSVCSDAMPNSSRSQSCCTEGEVDGVARELGPCTSTSPTQSQLESQTLLQSRQKLWEYEI